MKKGMGLAIATSYALKAFEQAEDKKKQEALGAEERAFVRGQRERMAAGQEGEEMATLDKALRLRDLDMTGLEQYLPGQLVDLDADPASPPTAGKPAFPMPPSRQTANESRSAAMAAYGVREQEETWDSLAGQGRGVLEDLRSRNARLRELLPEGVDPKSLPPADRARLAAQLKPFVDETETQLRAFGETSKKALMGYQDARSEKALNILLTRGPQALGDFMEKNGAPKADADQFRNIAIKDGKVYLANGRVMAMPRYAIEAGIVKMDAKDRLKFLMDADRFSEQLSGRMAMEELRSNAAMRRAIATAKAGGIARYNASPIGQYSLLAQNIAAKEARGEAVKPEDYARLDALRQAIPTSTPAGYEAKESTPPAMGRANNDALRIAMSELQSARNTWSKAMPGSPAAAQARADYLAAKIKVDALQRGKGGGAEIPAGATDAIE